MDEVDLILDTDKVVKKVDLNKVSGMGRKDMELVQFGEIEPEDLADRTESLASLRDGLLSKAEQMVGKLNSGEFEIPPTPYNIGKMVSIAMELDKVVELRKAEMKRGRKSGGKLVELSERKATVMLDDLNDMINKAGVGGIANITKDLEDMYE